MNDNKSQQSLSHWDHDEVTQLFDIALEQSEYSNASEWVRTVKRELIADVLDVEVNEREALQEQLEEKRTRVEELKNQIETIEEQVETAGLPAADEVRAQFETSPQQELVNECVRLLESGDDVYLSTLPLAERVDFDAAEVIEQVVEQADPAQEVIITDNQHYPDNRHEFVADAS